MLHIKFGFNWPSDFRGEGCLFIVVIYMYIAPGWGHKSPSHFVSVKVQLNGYDVK